MMNPEMQMHNMNVVCNHCKERGHYAPKCPMRIKRQNEPVKNYKHDLKKLLDLKAKLQTPDYEDRVNLHEPERGISQQNTCLSGGNSDQDMIDVN